jgi:hypothetical protein
MPLGFARPPGQCLTYMFSTTYPLAEVPQRSVRKKIIGVGLGAVS